jgi:two-component system response regulator HydG
MARVLVVEDDAAMRDLVLEELADRGHRGWGAATLPDAQAYVETGEVDVLVTDVNLARESGITLCRRVLGVDPDLPVIIITAFGSLDTAIQAIRAGAYDFLTKPFAMDALALAVDRAAALRGLKREVAELRVRMRREQRRSRLDGSSPEIVGLRESVATVATTDATVLVLGESGSGKEVVAREIHDLSRRSSSPFVAENVSAIPANLVESTLFGHVKGAFTGATGAREGLFRAAHGGTLLLDEIGELPLELQPKLLRVLEEGRVRPVGSDTEVPVDVRVLAATHRDLGEAVADGRFREDLFYRLAVIDLAVPPLRRRGGDILLLAQRFLEEHATRQGREVRSLHHETAAALLAWPWPGNVRELRNAMERAVALARGPLVMPTDLPPRMRDVPAAEVVPIPRDEPLLPMAEVERRHVLRVLQAMEGNKAEAARVLGIGRKTLYRKLELWGVPLGQDDTGSED